MSDSEKRRQFIESLEPRQLLATLPVLDLPRAESLVPAGISATVADPLRERFYLADPTNNQVRVVDASSGSQVAAFSVSGSPNLVAITPDASTLLVSIAGAHRIDVITVNSWQVTRSVSVPHQPIQIVPVAGSSFYSINKSVVDGVTSNEMLRFSMISGALTQTVATEVYRDIVAATDASGQKLYVSGHMPLNKTNCVEVFDATAASSKPVSLQRIAFPEGGFSSAITLSLDSAENRLYMAGSSVGSVYFYDLTQAAWTEWSLKAFDQMGLGFESCLEIINPPSSKYLYARLGGGGLGQIRKLNGKAVAYIAAPGNHIVRSPKGVLLATTNYYLDSGFESISSPTIVGVDRLSFPDQYPSLQGIAVWDSNGDGVSDEHDSGSIYGNLFADLNNNGIEDQGEPVALVSAIAGKPTKWTLWLRTPGTVTVRLRPAGNDGALPPIETTTRPMSFTVADHQVLGGPTLTLATAVYAAGRIYYDTNANGTQDMGENNPDADVYLDLNESGQFDAGEPLHTNRYGADPTNRILGAYDFYLIPNRRYVVRALPVEGAPYFGPDHLTLVLPPGQNSEVDFRVNALQIMKGIIVEDLDGDGMVDQREQPLQGATIWFDLNRNGKADANEPGDKTDALGRYEISLSVDAYAAKPSFLLGGNRYFDHKNRRYYAPYPVTVSDFAIYQPGSISVRAFEDRDRNRKRNKGDRWMAGHTVFLDYNGNGKLDRGEPTQILDLSGSAVFANVAPATHSVVVIPPKRYASKVYRKSATLTGGGHATLSLPVS